MTGTQIDPETVYRDEDLAGGLDISFQTLARARSSGELRFRRLGKQIVYLGQWVLEWLAKDSTPDRAG